MPEIPSLLAVKITETCAIYRLASRRYIDYFEGARTIWDEDQDRLSITSENSDRLYELAFLAIHSIMGQNLDLRGLCRVHALGVSLGNRNAVVMLPSKGGKSTLLTHLLENPEISIISDDMPLINNQGEVLPFPSKLSLDQAPTTGILSTLEWKRFDRAHYPPKYTASLSKLKNRIEQNSKDKKTILIAGYRLSSGESMLSTVSRWKMLGPLCEHMIIGMGLPQILEMFLSFKLTDVLKLSYIAAIRTHCALKLLFKSDCYHFYLGPDKAYNSQLLLDKLYEH